MFVCESYIRNRLTLLAAVGCRTDTTFRVRCEVRTGVTLTARCTGFRCALNSVYAFACFI